MLDNFVNIHVINNTVDCRIDHIGHMFSLDNFISKTKYPFAQTINFSLCEQEHNEYTVQYVDGSVQRGKDLPEIIWCIDNFSLIKEIMLLEIPKEELEEQQRIYLWSIQNKENKC
jgi:hypothetical protein